MARLLNWPLGVKVMGRRPLSGPNVYSSGPSLSGDIQTISSPFGLQSWQFDIQPLNGAALRDWRGMVAALHGGANALRVSFYDVDGFEYTTNKYKRPITTTSNGLTLSNGKPIITFDGEVSIDMPTAKDGTLIHLKNENWGYDLQVGDWIGFAPFHFGLYHVTEAYDDGLYRIWPPLRKALTTDDIAVKTITMAMRMTGEGAAPLNRGASHAMDLSITLTEIPDYTVRAYFTS